MKKDCESFSEKFYALDKCDNCKDYKSKSNTIFPPLFEITIIITEEELTIYKKLDEAVCELIVHEFSQVPSIKKDDDTFNRLREIALREWYKKCGDIIKQTIDAL